MTKKKRLFILSLMIALVLAVWAYNSSTTTAQTTRTCVCHIEDKKANTGHIIEVDDNSLAGHSAHGDDVCTTCDDSNIGQPCSTGDTGDLCPTAQ